jgi:hypothetical protein
VPRTTLALTSFVSGEFGNKLTGRTDFEKYQSAAKKMENFLVHPQGAATRRVGTQFIDEVKDSSKKTRLIPFEFSTTQTYILEFGNQYIRFFKDKGQILSGGSAYEIASPYLEAELFEIKFAQSADVMYLVHPNHNVRKLSRTGHTSWSLATVSFSGSPSLPISGSNNRPSCVSFYEQRLAFAGTNNNPQTIWFSKAGDYENFTTGTNADDAMIYTIASNQVNAIRYLKAQRTLVVGTSGGEFTVSADGTDASITPTNVTIKKQSSYGSANVDAVAAGNAILFLQKAKRKIRELAYNFDSDSYVAPDLTILNDAVTESGIVQMEWQQEPDNILWCVRDDGQLAALTYQRSEAVVSWHRHILGGSFGSGNAVVESIASISGVLNEDELWCIVKRTINGSTKRYVECFSDFNFDETDATDFKFLDSHLTYSGSATTSLSGLSHLEGQTVSILADGSVHANKTVSSGSITLDRSVTKAVVGLSYDSVLQTMRIEGGAAEGTSQGKTKRISKVVLRLFETVGVKVGPSLSNLETIPFRTTSSNLSAPVETLLEGDKEIEFNDDFNSDGFIFIKQDQPLPASILAIYPTLVTNDG